MQLEHDGTLTASEENKLMTDDEFEREVELAAQGRWAELGLDELPDDFQPATMEELRGA